MTRTPAPPAAPQSSASAAPAAAPKGSPYTRFIPREELNSFAPWTLNSLTADNDATAPKPPGTGLRRASDQAGSPAADEAPDAEAQMRTARQSGYQDGYRDGMAALDGFKQSFAQQMTRQVGVLMESVAQQLDALEKDMARCLVDAATHLAQRVVRSELEQRPDHVEAVARETIESLLRSARHITMKVHPDDLPLVEQGAGEGLQARGARLMADDNIARGGCLVESDIGVIDATIETRWREAASAMGSGLAWPNKKIDEADLADAAAVAAVVTEAAEKAAPKEAQA
jgi:flagellar assembly protein FliH